MLLHKDECVCTHLWKDCRVLERLLRWWSILLQLRVVGVKCPVKDASTCWLHGLGIKPPTFHLEEIPPEHKPPMISMFESPRSKWAVGTRWNTLLGCIKRMHVSYLARSYMTQSRGGGLTITPSRCDCWMNPSWPFFCGCLLNATSETVTVLIGTLCGRLLNALSRLLRTPFAVDSQGRRERGALITS